MCSVPGDNDWWYWEYLNLACFLSAQVAGKSSAVCISNTSDESAHMLNFYLWYVLICCASTAEVYIYI